MTRIKYIRAVVTLIITSLLIAACTPATPSQSQLQTVVAVTFSAMTVQSASTSIPTTTGATEQAPATPVPATVFSPYLVQISAQNVNLRVGPGTLFKVSRVLTQGTSLEVNGQSNGGEWLYVKNDEGVVGWVGIFLVEGSHDGPPAPFVDPGDAYLVTGKIETELGVPVSGIGFALTQPGFTSRRTDATTDTEGRFYAYIPSTLSGSWTVEYVSVACTSNTMDVSCNCKGGRCGEPEPRIAEISVPFSGELNFVWK